MCTHRLCPCLALLLSLIASSAALAQDVTTVPLPCGIADAGGRTGILVNTSGGLDVIDLTTGDLLWETKEAQQPILVLGQKLYAQARVTNNSLRVLAFDLAERGPCVYQSDPVVFPAWVSSVEAPGRSFTARWQRERNLLYLRWEAAAWNTAGPNLFRLTGKPTSKTNKGRFDFASGNIESLEKTESRQSASGLVSFNLESGKVEQLSDKPEIGEPTPSLPADASRLALRWQGVVNKNFTAVSLDARMDKQVVNLRVWDRISGKQAAPIELLRGYRPIVQTTLDGRFLCLRDATPSPDQKTRADDRAWQYGWTVVTPENGSLVARLPFEPGTQSVALAGNRAYFLVTGPIKGDISRPIVRPQTVKAIDIKSGKLVWERAVVGKNCFPPER